MYTHCLYIAIWSDKAKDQMVRWAIKAGLISGDLDGDSFEMKIPNQMQIVYEPDCAALSIQHAIYRSMKKQKSPRTKKKSPGNMKKKKKRGRKATIKAMQTLIPQIRINVPFQKNDKYILLDVVGGTCDVACHRVINEFEIAEVLHPSGSVYFDRLLENMTFPVWKQIL